ncbi:MAG TPA: hypothetical protein VFM82_03590 [Flavobacteriaceae bacterium]|nr:hypothetical protein [Flavobacteriaceae bacterium]
MTIKELKQKIENLPDTMDVFIDERVSEFTYGLVNSAKVREINFMEEPGGKALSKNEVLIFSEE